MLDLVDHLLLLDLDYFILPYQSKVRFILIKDHLFNPFDIPVNADLLRDGLGLLGLFVLAFVLDLAALGLVRFLILFDYFEVPQVQLPLGELGAIYLVLKLSRLRRGFQGGGFVLIFGFLSDS